MKTLVLTLFVLLTNSKMQAQEFDMKLISDNKKLTFIKEIISKPDSTLILLEKQRNLDSKIIKEGYYPNYVHTKYGCLGANCEKQIRLDTIIQLFFNDTFENFAIKRIKKEYPTGNNKVCYMDDIYLSSTNSYYTIHFQWVFLCKQWYLTALNCTNAIFDPSHEDDLH